MKLKAIVPVKLNSKRLPYKNIMKINDVPIIEWTINTLNKIEKIDEIIVYCSDESIENHIKSKHTFIKRDKILDRDDKNIHDIFNHMFKEDNIHSDYWLLQHCTSPFIKKETMQDMIDKVISNKYPYSSAFAVTKHQKYSWYMGKPLNFCIKNIGFTQTTEPIYIETSGPWIFKEKSFLENGDRVSKDYYMKIVPFEEGIDIDNKDDFELAKLIGEKN